MTANAELNGEQKQERADPVIEWVSALFLSG